MTDVSISENPSPRVTQASPLTWGWERAVCDGRCVSHHGRCWGVFDMFEMRCDVGVELKLGWAGRREGGMCTCGVRLASVPVTWWGAVNSVKGRHDCEVIALSCHVLKSRYVLYHS